MQLQSNYQAIQITPLPNGEWEVNSPWGKGSGNGHYPHFKMNQDSGPHLMSFEIVGGVKNVTFADQPIAVKVGSKPQPGDTNPQIAWVQDAAPTKLWVMDWNTNPASDGNLALNYVLYVNGHNPLDPIIDNGGTTRPPPPPPPPPPTAQEGAASTNTTTGGSAHQGGFDWTSVVIGLVIGLIIGLALCWWRRKNPERSGA